MDFWFKFSIWVFPVIFSVTLHEIAHGWVALYFGDNTAKISGRLSLNPLRHIDWLGSLLLPSLLLLMTGFIFGWAKPVPIDMNQLRHSKYSMGLVALAGPMANFIMSLLWVFVLKLGLYLSSRYPNFSLILVYLGVAGVFINSAVMMLNLLPIPPLDGGRVLVALLAEKQAQQLSSLEKWGFPLLIILLFSGVLSTGLWFMMSLQLAALTFLAHIPVDVFNHSLAELLN